MRRWLDIFADRAEHASHAVLDLGQAPVIRSSDLLVLG
jgi:hypothetical protein